MALLADRSALRSINSASYADVHCSETTQRDLIGRGGLESLFDMEPGGSRADKEPLHSSCRDGTTHTEMPPQLSNKPHGCTKHLQYNTLWVCGCLLAERNSASSLVSQHNQWPQCQLTITCALLPSCMPALLSGIVLLLRADWLASSCSCAAAMLRETLLGSLHPVKDHRRMRSAAALVVTACKGFESDSVSC